MWPLLSGLWKARRGRKSAVAIILPLVERSRQRPEGVPDSAWLDPYLVGLLAMLITLVARREVNALDSQALGLVQRGAWGQITGMKSDLIGEEILHCCATGDRDFERGCRDAITVDLALYRSAIVQNAEFDFSGGWMGSDGEEGHPETGTVIQLWEHYFDTHVMAHIAAYGASPDTGIARSAA